MPQPIVRTSRLTLRPFTFADAPIVQQCVSDFEIARNVRSIPHPYPEGGAIAWIEAQCGRFDRGDGVLFAIDEGGRLVGAIGLTIERADRRAELGYWIAPTDWGRGLATEAAAAAVRFGFEVLGLNRVHATHYGRNPASGRVLQKIAMTHEGCLRAHQFHFGEFVDLVCYGAVRGHWSAPALQVAPAVC